MAEREPGFYWVKFDNEEQVAEWRTTGEWWLTGDDRAFSDADLAEIGEPVVRICPNEKAKLEALALAVALEELASALDHINAGIDAVIMGVSVTLVTLPDGTQAVWAFYDDFVADLRAVLDAAPKAGDTKPQPITDAQKNGEQWLVWGKTCGGWLIAFWDRRIDPPMWCAVNHTFHTPISQCSPTHYLPLPPDVKGDGND